MCDAMSSNTYGTTQMPLNKAGLLFMSVGGQPPTAFGDGVKCPVGTTFRYVASNSGATGSMTTWSVPVSGGRLPLPASV